MHHWCTSMHWCLCWCSALIWLENTWFSPLLPLILPLFLFCCRSVNCKLFSGLSFLSFRHDDKHKKSWAPDFRVERKFAKVTCRPLLCCQARWWRPGRVETSCRSGGWTSTSSACPPRALLVVRASLTPPSLLHLAFNISWKGRCWASASSWSWSSDLYTIVTGCTGNVNQRLLPALANSLLLLTGFMALLPHDLFCDIFWRLSTTSTPPCPTYGGALDNESSTPGRTQAVSRLSHP